MTINQPSPIGTFVSSGCIRLTNRDIMEPPPHPHSEEGAGKSHPGQAEGRRRAFRPGLYPPNELSETRPAHARAQPKAGFRSEIAGARRAIRAADSFTKASRLVLTHTGQ